MSKSNRNNKNVDVTHREPKYEDRHNTKRAKKYIKPKGKK